MDDLQAQITEEIAAITDFLEQRLGRRSRWNGAVELSDDDNFGKALWNGSISLDRGIVQTELRWRTMIHEALHHFSIGLTPTTYSELPGWEEGVVEQLQRLIRDDILDALQVPVSANLFRDAEREHRFNGFVTAIEDLRELLGADADRFYLNLLVTPLSNRPAEVMAASAVLPNSEQSGFRRRFAITFSVLRRR